LSIDWASKNAEPQFSFSSNPNALQMQNDKLFEMILKNGHTISLLVRCLENTAVERQFHSFTQ